MTRDEVKKLIMIITYTYPNYKPQDLSVAVDIWTEMLSDFTYEQASCGLQAFIRTDTNGFAPSIGQLIDKIHSIFPSESEINANEAWALVYKAICNSTYHSEEEFAKLPELVQKAVGSAENLRSLAITNDFNQEVEKSLFSRTYEVVKKREQEISKLPESMRVALTGNQNMKLVGNETS